MFKKFENKSLGSQSQLKASVQRQIRQLLITQLPKLALPLETETASELEILIEHLLPKKQSIYQVKHETSNIVSVSPNPEIYLFINNFDGPYMPTLVLLHRYPDLLPHIQADKGAVKFIMKGADVMAPGLVSKGIYSCNIVFV